MSSSSPPPVGGPAPSRRLNILVVYYYAGEHPVRATSADHLYCFRRYTDQNCYYLNLAFRDVPDYLLKVPFDLVIFHTLFFSARWSSEAYSRAVRRARPLKGVSGVKAAVPQDEFIHTDSLRDFINEFGVTHVFTVAPESEWAKIYEGVDPRRVRFFQVLTGYLDDSTVRRIERLAARGLPRTVDLGYRAWRAEPWLGRHGMLKTRVSELFARAAAERGLVADISTRAEDTFLGDAWYEFLLRCKYMPGVEGGASVLDRDGSVRARTDAYLREHPGARFEEVEAACFPGLDGSLRLAALSPRNLEACATRTCQVLVGGEYSGVLRAGEHYIELRPDFGNIEQVLEAVGRDDLRGAMTERAYRDVVASGKYSYRSFVSAILSGALGGAAPAPAASPRPAGLLYRWASLTDRLTWIIVMLHWYINVLVKRRVRQRLVNILSEETVSSVARRIKGSSQI